MDFNRKVKQEDYTNTMPEYPARYLTIHCAVKGLQLGSILGLALTPPVAYFRKIPIMQAFTRTAPVSVVGGVGLVLGILYYKYYEGVLDEAGVDDRAYRLANSAGQVKVDQYTFVGSLIGASTGAVFGRGGARSILAATSVGVTSAVVYYLTEKTGHLQQAKDFIDEQTKK